jgi:hypothetical protein
MTTEQQNQLNASSMKIENWQNKKRILEEKNFNLTENDLSYSNNKTEDTNNTHNSKIGKAFDGLYKFIEAL